ncbi:MAG: glycoside hydrolase family 2 TIM barrel-domain containing protein [Phycisphaeraceae bacterium JB051]
MNRIASSFVCWLLLLSISSITQAQHLVTNDLIWIEGEQPDATKVNFKISESPRPHLLSDGKMLLQTFAKNQIPKRPWELSYSFDVKRAGDYALWFRIGFEWVRAPFEYKLDDGVWIEASNRDQTTQVMELTTWNEIAWLQGDDMQLTPGKHTLSLRFSEGGLDGRQLVALDCIALGRDGFEPQRMYHIPQSPIDQQAVEQVYRLQAQSMLNQRSRVDLTGLWQIARYDDADMDAETYEPVKQLPNMDALRWLAINVPGKGRGAWAERDELSFGHRLLYKTRVMVPDHIGDSFQLNFEATNWIVSVFVNGKLAGTHKSVLVPWAMDVTDHIARGKVNEIVIAVKSPWYAIDIKARKGRTSSLDHARNTPPTDNFLKNRSYVAPVYPSTKGEGNGMTTGIIGPVSLTATGMAYVEDAFVITKVNPAQTLNAQITLHNPTNRQLAVQWLGSIIDLTTNAPIKTGLQLQATLKPKSTQTIELPDTAMPNAKRWWPEEGAQLYQLQSKLLMGGQLIDTHEQNFGFREVSIVGKDFLLNGVPWHFYNWVGVPEHHDVDQWLKTYHAQGDRFHRVAQDHDRIFGSRKNALDYFDQHGIPGRLSTCIDGMFITHDLENPIVWDNFEEHVAQVVKAYRNHPSVMMYSLGNEMFFVTAFLRHGNNYRVMEQRAAKLHGIAKQLDPTRASFQDGGGDLGGLGEINCQHYSWPKGGSFPLAAYDYPTGKPNGEHTRAEVFKWSGKNPLVLGEVFYYSGNLSKMAWVGGPMVYRGRQHADIGAGKYLNIAMQGARWQGVTAICPWTRKLPGCEPAFSPRAVFIKQHNANVYPNSTLKRTIKLLNDTRFDDPIQMVWQLITNNTVVGQGTKTYNIKAGHSQEDELTLPIPQAMSDMTLTLRLQLNVKGQTVFTDEHSLELLFPEQYKDPVFGQLGVFDPSGKVIKWLQQKRIPHYAMQDLMSISARLQTILIGPNALNNLNKTDRNNLISHSKIFNTIVLEQANPITGKELGLDLQLADDKQDAGKVSREEFEGAKGQTGQIAFIASPAHAVFKGMHNDQFFTWADGSYNFTNSYAMPSSGMLPMISAGHDLNLCPMVQINKQRGSIVLSQMLIGSKLGVEPLADRLLTRLLNLANAASTNVAKRTALLSSGDRQLTQLIKQTGVQYDEVGDVANLLRQLDSHQVMIVKATPQNLNLLNARKQQLTQWANAGGKMMLVNLTPQGIDRFNELVGFPHQIRAGMKERVRLDHLANPLLLGISDRDLPMDSDKFIARWRHQYDVSDRVFSHVVDGYNIASFAKPQGHQQNMVNGLINADFWRYISYVAPDESVRFAFDHPNRLVSLNIWTNESYKVIKRMRVILDGNQRTAINVELEDKPDMQTIPLNGQAAQTIDIQLLEMYDKPSSKNLTGIDNIQIIRSIPEPLAKKITMLSNPGGLVEYPLGSGCLLLNNLDYQKPDTQTNEKKKLGIWSNLLRNMGAAMSNQ